MIAVDANLLVYAYVADFQQHDAARGWLEVQLAGRSRVGLPWPSLLAFMRLVTNPRVFSAPDRIEATWQQVESWLAAPPVWTPAPTADHRAILGACLQTPGLRADDVPDAHLAALAIEHGLELATTDPGFKRFEGLRSFDPLST